MSIVQHENCSRGNIIEAHEGTSRQIAYKFLWLRNSCDKERFEGTEPVCSSGEYCGCSLHLVTTFLRWLLKLISDHYSLPKAYSNDWIFLNQSSAPTGTHWRHLHIKDVLSAVSGQIARSCNFLIAGNVVSEEDSKCMHNHPRDMNLDSFLKKTRAQSGEQWTVPWKVLHVINVCTLMN